MQQQHSVARTVPFVVDGESAVSTSAAVPHSAVDEKSPSDFLVQFDVIIISDSNSVSNSQFV